MPKKTNDIGQRRKKGSDKRRRTYELYGKYSALRDGDTIVQAGTKLPTVSKKKKGGGRKRTR